MREQRNHQYMLRIAEITAEMSKCNRLKVGCVFEKDGRPLSTGWNGILEGVLDDCCEDLDGKTKDSVIHAEMNALRYMARAGISTQGTTLYITHAPCINCATHLAGLGLTKVIYKEDYKSLEGVDHLLLMGVDVQKINKK